MDAPVARLRPFALDVPRGLPWRVAGVLAVWMGRVRRVAHRCADAMRRALATTGRRDTRLMFTERTIATPISRTAGRPETE
ncbi:MAG TPA: hypothetical protein DEU95_10005 [Chloroflexi bacterium]|nr:hypothetical protein [Chloroflexota bacterium]HCG30051.1 hypothetical protein [Chloroflexota bacterium]